MTTSAPIPIGLMAKRLRVSVSWLRRESEANRIPHLKADAQILFDPELVEAILLERARREVDPVAAATEAAPA